MLTQYRELKQRYPDAVLLFCVGKNYEAYCTDADNCSEILKLERTRRELNGCYQPIPCVQFPHKMLDEYLSKLVRAGKRVAIIE